MVKKAIKTTKHIQNTPFREALIAYYQKHKRYMPWRETTYPYAIWLSEIMLQQTGVSTVIPYFNKFMATFPTVDDLAKANQEEVLHLWQGLGYYSRARNLHKCAQTVVVDYNGIFPSATKELLGLPGIGAYTASAIRTMAFNQPDSVVDGNVERVISRLFQIKEPLPLSKPVIKKYAKNLSCPEHPALYANAIMELGATVCTPTSPKCDTCPVSAFCKLKNAASVANYPFKVKKKKNPIEQGVAYCIFDKKGRIYLQKRPSKGLLANLWEVPSEGWRQAQPLPTIIQKSKAQSAGDIKHVFTHFTLNFDVKRIDLDEEKPEWFDINALPPIPVLVRKVIDSIQK
jgi:A/G-specific adenine glycosylase